MSNLWLFWVLYAAESNLNTLTLQPTNISTSTLAPLAFASQINESISFLCLSSISPLELKDFLFPLYIWIGNTFRWFKIQMIQKVI